MARATISIFVLLFIMAGGVVLQIFLSKRESKWFGLILPFITFLYSLMAMLGMAAFAGMTTGEMVVQTLIVLLVSNIPTFILLAVYFACRHSIKEAKKKNTEINKMNIKDL